MDKNLIILLISILTGIIAIGTGIVQYLIAKQNDRETKLAEQKADDFRKKLEQASYEQQVTLQQLAEANKRAHESEREFRLFMTGGDIKPFLKILAIKHNMPSVGGDYVELHVDILNPGDLPLHNVSVDITDLFSYELYNTIRITRSINGSYASDGNPKFVDRRDYDHNKQLNIGTLPKLTKRLPIYTCCYKLVDDVPSIGFNVTVTWGAGKLVYFLHFNRDTKDFNLANTTEIVLDDTKVTSGQKKYMQFEKLKF